MTTESYAYTAVGIPWNGAWDVVLLDPAGNVLATASAAASGDVASVGRHLLRTHLPRGRRPVRLRVECRVTAAAPARGRVLGPG